MENALWNEKLITAAKISSDYYLEKQIRMASGRKELFCPDPDCENSVLRYCHGEKKEAYFAHLNNVDCDYAKFDKENSSVLRKIKKLLYEHFTGLGYDVKIEVKLLKHHYTHLLITKTDGKQIAIELGTQRLSANKVENLTRKYNEAGVSVCWIVVSELNSALKENQTYFIKRYSLNESRRKTLISISFDGQTVAQYKLDQNQYVLNGRVVVSENYPDVFMKISSINDLVFIEDELTLCDFDKEFDEFIVRKRNAFEKKKANWLREEQRQREAAENRKQERDLGAKSQRLCDGDVDYKAPQLTPNLQQKKINLPTKQVDFEMICEERKEEIEWLVEQEKVAIDSLGIRWVKCEECNKIKISDKFSCVGIPKNNLGICQECNMRNHRIKKTE